MFYDVIWLFIAQQFLYHMLGSQYKAFTMQVHSKNFNVGVQALMLLDKISSKNQVVSDRFYRALYDKLRLPAALNSSKASKFGSFYCVLPFAV